MDSKPNKPDLEKIKDPRMREILERGLEEAKRRKEAGLEEELRVSAIPPPTSPNTEKKLEEIFGGKRRLKVARYEAEGYGKQTKKDD